MFQLKVKNYLRNIKTYITKKINFKLLFKIEMISFLDIPDDIILFITSMTDPHIRINMMKTCKELYKLLKNNDVFKLPSRVYRTEYLTNTLIINKKYTQDLIFKRKLLAALGLFKIINYDEKFDKFIFDKSFQSDIRIDDLFDVDFDRYEFTTNLNKSFKIGMYKIEDNVDRYLEGVTFSNYFEYNTYDISEDFDIKFLFKLKNNRLSLKVNRNNKFKISLPDFKYKPSETFCYYSFNYCSDHNDIDEHILIIISNLDSLYKVKIYNYTNKSSDKTNIKVRQFKLKKIADNVKCYFYRDCITFIYYDNMNNIININTNKECKIYNNRYLFFEDFSDKNNIIDIVTNQEIIDKDSEVFSDTLEKRTNLTIREVMERFYRVDNFKLKSVIVSNLLKISKTYVTDSNDDEEEEN